jgi:hypothetical protein
MYILVILLGNILYITYGLIIVINKHNYDKSILEEDDIKQYEYQ